MIQVHSGCSILPAVFRHGCIAIVALIAAMNVRASEITAVYSEVARGYSRGKLADGSIKPEYYAFGEGGLRRGGPVDPSIDGLKFAEVARTVADPLATQKFLPCLDPAKTNLLIMVYWGTTLGNDGLSASDGFRGVAGSLSTPPGVALDTRTIAHEEATAMTPDSQMNVAIAVDNNAISHQKADDLDGVLFESHVGDLQRDQSDFRNAVILGYYSELVNTEGLDHTALGGHRHDLIEELEADRYYVVLMAYDFQSLLKKKEKKLLWVTRISIRARGNKFDKQLAAMTAYASKYFGQDSHGLLREPLPEGRVEYGELKTVGYQDTGAKAAGH